ncbi:MAG: YerC/YecD family TrpR-related protein [Anaerovoracaceae bacterium]|nr:YerC/YecD family TrpR-related protein [Anaerovoracaceae bacterium]
MAYTSKLKSRENDELFRAILSLENEEECYRFFEDLCTINEIHAMSQRLQVAMMLDDNETYSEIKSKSKISTATISRINRCLLYGADGYRTVIAKLKKNKE